jgi:murein L,D-transpeptidase YafK
LQSYIAEIKKQILGLQNRISDESIVSMSTPFLLRKNLTGQAEFALRKNCKSSVNLLRILPFFAAPFLVSCGETHAEERQVANRGPIIKADHILVDKSDRVMILYKQNKEIDRYTNIKLGDAPVGHKRFEGDEKTPEGNYIINGRNPGSSYHLSLRVSYPNAADRAYAKARGKSPGGDIFIHGQPNMSPATRIDSDWTDGCIAVSNAEIKRLWKQIDDGTSIHIRP